MNEAIELVEAENARLKDIIRREAWLEEARESGVPGPYVSWDDHLELQVRLDRAAEDILDVASWCTGSNRDALKSIAARMFSKTSK